MAADNALALAVMVLEEPNREQQSFAVEIYGITDLQLALCRSSIIAGILQMAVTRQQLHAPFADQSHVNAPPVWYSVTRVSKKFFSFFRSSSSLIHGKGLVAPGYCSGRPIWAQRRLAMKRRYSLNITAFRPSTPRGMVST